METYRLEEGAGGRRDMVVESRQEGGGKTED